jgi:hypothetical protein
MLRRLGKYQQPLRYLRALRNAFTNCHQEGTPLVLKYILQLWIWIWERPISSPLFPRTQRSFRLNHWYIRCYYFISSTSNCNQYWQAEGFRITGLEFFGFCETPILRIQFLNWRWRRKVVKSRKVRNGMPTKVGEPLDRVRGKASLDTTLATPCSLFLHEASDVLPTVAIYYPVSTRICRLFWEE